MKTPFAAVLVCLAATCFVGCASRNRGPIYHAGDENPPDFVNGALTVVLTNLHGFSAHAVETTAAPDGSMRGKSGELLARDGKFLYEPTLAAKGKRARTEGGLFFIWDENKHSGYVMSEALQSYAPLRSDTTNAPVESMVKQDIAEDVDGHHCQRYEAIIPLGNGLKTRALLWQAEDLRHFPIRIEWSNGPDRMTLNFTDIHLESPAAGLFQPPEGFSAYVNSAMLMNELIVREARLKKGSTTGEFDEPSDVRSGNWHQSSSATGNP